MKEEKIKNSIKFLIEINKNMNYKEIENLYLNKYKLNERSNKINIRVLKRSLFIINKLDEKVKSENVKILKEKLNKKNINYNDLVDKIKLCKKNNIINIRDLEI